MIRYFFYSSNITDSKSTNYLRRALNIMQADGKKMATAKRRTTGILNDQWHE